MWTTRHVQFVLFTTKLTKDTKDSGILNSELREFRVLRGEHLLAYLVAALPRWVLRGEYCLSYLVAASPCKFFVVKKHLHSKPGRTFTAEQARAANIKLSLIHISEP